MSKQACGLCGRDPAAGFAGVDGVRYCHGDFDPDPTCYMKAQRAIAGIAWDEMPFDVYVVPEAGKRVTKSVRTDSEQKA